MIDIQGNNAKAVTDAMWAGDVDLLDKLAHCECCCDEHTSGSSCPAYVWGGCRGQGTMTHEDETSWFEHYRQNHGMTKSEFYG